MTIEEAIKARHSVRRYVSKPLPQEIIDELQAETVRCNTEGRLHIQLVVNEPKGFDGIASYGMFHGVENYFVMAACKDDGVKERVGYYGERLLLKARQLGLSCCWVGVTYREIKGAFTLEEGEKVICMISLGYAADEGSHMPKKSIEQLSNVSDTTPEWFRHGMEAARLAPTAVNQQKFRMEYIAPDRVKAHPGFSLIGYTRIDLGIAKYHFEVGAGRENFKWE